MSFVHLHVHSEYSLLDGFSNVKSLVTRAKEMEMPALALTDHGNMFGAISFYKEAKSVGIKPIIGMEAYLAARRMQDRDPKLDKRSFHLLLIAQNETGYNNLLKLASEAQINGFYYNPRIDHNLLAKHSEGLIATSGCMSAEIPRLILSGKIQKAQKKLDWYFEVFGPDRFFLELQHHNIERLDSLNQTLLDLGKRYQAQFLATNDVHYAKQTEAHLQDILLAIQTGCVLSDPDRLRMTDNTYHLRSAAEMDHLFHEVPGAVENTLKVAELCELDLDFKGYHLPEFDVPPGLTPQVYLRQRCEEGLARRYGSRVSNPVIQERLDYELGVIHDMGFDTYFLIVWDLCRFAREEGIWYNARGSAAGSIVAYALEITLVDPLEHGLIFERFLNPGRISMPDIDLDFRDDLRYRMLEYCVDKYGDDKVAQIITFGTLKARAAIRDVGRVMDIPLPEVDRIAKLIPNIPGKPISIEEALDKVSEFQQAYQSSEYVRELIDTAKHMEGVVRNAGTHAAGVIITDKPIVEYVPLHRSTGQAEDNPIKSITQFEMEILDSLGLLKVDFLGLATLTVMARACELIRERHGIHLDLDTIPTDDPGIYELLGRGETAGIFQVEGAGMRRHLIEMKPKTLDNVIAMVALYRPGPMDFIPSYIKRMHGQEEITYRHPALEPILEETYGITVYQEQIMYTAMKLAGYTASEADDLRKAVAKKKANVLFKHRRKFVGGANTNDIPTETANKIFDDWVAFARYGFPKGHAADYGVISAQTAYLKAKFPVEYMTALLCVSMNDTDKVALYVGDSRRMDIEVLPPDVNTSELDFTIEDTADGKAAIRFGLGAVKNVGQGPVHEILKGRQDGGFEDLNDFARKVDLRQVGRRPLESLIRVGALRSFGPRVALLEALDRIIAVSTQYFRAKETGQLSLFGPRTGVIAEISLPEPNFQINRREQLNWERELIGLYVSDHPLNPVADQLASVVTHFSSQLAETNEKERVRVAGIVSAVRHHQTRHGKAMAFVKLDDLYGTIDLVVFPNQWRQAISHIEIDKLIAVEGTIDVRGGEPKILVDAVQTELKISKPRSEPVTPAPLQEPDRISQLRPKVDPQPGKTSADMSAMVAQPEPGPSPPTAPGAPPPPDSFPSDWEFPPIPNETTSSPPFEAVVASAGGKALEIKTDTADPTEIEPIIEPDTNSLDLMDADEKGPIPADIRAAVEITDRSQEPGGGPETSETPPVLKMVTVHLRASGDKARDILRLRRIHGTLISFPGQDRFGFYVVEAGRAFMLEFPNFTTGVCDELIQRLTLLVGKENIHIDPITFQ